METNTLVWGARDTLITVTLTVPSHVMLSDIGCIGSLVRGGLKR